MKVRKHFFETLEKDVTGAKKKYGFKYSKI